MGLGIFKDSEVERGRELVFHFRGSIWILIFGLYSKRDLLTEMAEVSNECLTEGTSDGVSDKF